MYVIPYLIVYLYTETESAVFGEFSGVPKN